MTTRTRKTQAVRRSYRFRPGDRVVRPVDVYVLDSPLRHGTVRSRYSAATKFGDYPELYAVKWDDGAFSYGYLPHGLDPERLSK
jgi:hypothetical protein